MLPSQPMSPPKTIKHLLSTLGERIELHPVYQRDIKWSAENMGDLINSVMCSGFIPGILLYELQAGDERAKETYRHEVVDGQHRFFTLLHFFHSRPVVLPGKKPFLITLPYKEAGHVTHVFYKKTADTDAWVVENSEKRVAYMTEEEQDHFSGFLLDIREIRDPLTLDQRRKTFLSLQKGVPVRGSDFYKNMTDVPLVKFISEERRWETQVKQLMLAHLAMNPQQYWLHWVIRLFFIQQAEGSDARVAAFMTKDSAISQMIKKGNAALDSSPENMAAFGVAADRFFAFLGGLPAGVKLTPTQFYASFAHLLDSGAEREDVISSHMRQWSTEGMNVKQRKMWENRGFEDEERQDAFERAIDEIERISVPAPEVEPRKKIPKKLREKVWANAFGEEEIGDCVCCARVIDVEHWECAHILAHKCGGKDEERNLVPTCRSCNREMGTENLAVFKARCYPSV